MNTTQWLDAARAQQEALMVAACTITTGAGKVWDETLGRDVTTPGTVVYSGKCSLLQATNRQGLAAPAGGQQVETGQQVLKLPWNTVGVRAGMTATVTSPDPDAQPAVVTVVDAAGGDMLTCRRLTVERQVGT